MPTLTRTMFETKRTLEHFTEAGLTMQLGGGPERWGLILIRELIDNALDACETARVIPHLTIDLSSDGFSVSDNGPGIPGDVVTRALDFGSTVSDKAHYISPSRGQLGNALKALVAAPYTCDRQRPGSVVVVSQGRRHTIRVRVDKLAQVILPWHTVLDDPLVKIGTIVEVKAPRLAYLDENELNDFYNLVHPLIQDYAMFNPHATFTLSGPDEDARTYTAPQPTWSKWAPSDPTSPDWYSTGQLSQLIGAYISEERRGARARTVREFIGEFAGLSSSAKQKIVSDRANLSRAYLHNLALDGEVSPAAVETLLAAMRAEARPVKAKHLGEIGRDHILQTLVDQQNIDPSTFAYKRVRGEENNLPYILEVAFACSTTNNRIRERRDYQGVNWAANYTPPFTQIESTLNHALVASEDEVVIVVHLAIPRPTFTNRSKQGVELPYSVARALRDSLTAVVQRWTKAKQSVMRDRNARARAADELRRASRQSYPTIQAAAYEVMVAAYLKASGNGHYVAHARQIMYAAREPILAMIDPEKAREGFRDQYFTQILLPDFMAEHVELTESWDVVFDDRGHFTEPHRQHDRLQRIGLGTVAVRDYIKKWHRTISTTVETPQIVYDLHTVGPAHRYRFALFVEKEGFDPLLEQARIAERYDIAIMSTKGMSNTSARSLVEALTAEGVTILVLHDFDKSGFSILHTLRSDTRRYQFKRAPQVIDLGLTRSDVQEMGLASEPVTYKQQVDPREDLERCRASEAARDFLVRERQYNSSTEKWYWTGERVELNAMASDQLLGWLEQKLVEHGVVKVIPSDEVIRQAYQYAIEVKRVNDYLEQLPPEQGEAVEVPADFSRRLQEQMVRFPTECWDAALWDLVDRGL